MDVAYNPLFIMLHTETVGAKTLALIRQLMSDHQLEEFFLVGGTALSLLIGHRKSTGIDLISRWSFNAKGLSRYLQRRYRVENAKVLKNGVCCDIDGIKVDMHTHNYQRTDFWFEEDGIRMESIKDIGAMKLYAIVGNGVRLKNFVDVYFLLEYEPLGVFLDTFERKYPRLSRSVAMTALRDHRKIMQTPIVFMGQPISQQQFSKRFDEAFLQPLKVFDRTSLPGRDREPEFGH